MLCAFCGKEFAPKNSNQKFCSSDCYRQSLRSVTIVTIKKCANPNCGQEFITKNPAKKFCSRKCQDICYRPIQRQKQREYRKNTASTFSKQRDSNIKRKLGKTIEQWLAEAKQCNLDYGTYRALINSGKSFSDLQAIANHRQIPTHSHCHINLR